jgi:hypothetical protein
MFQQLPLVEREEEWKTGGGVTKCGRRWSGYEVRPTLILNTAAVGLSTIDFFFFHSLICFVLLK